MNDDPILSNNRACARCGQPFHCGASDAEPCWCCNVALDAATLAA
ncbi:cysteine-rich CWC family protein, partial [Piscinibacter sp.]